MTWKEFKDYVESQGIKDDMVIESIDIDSETIDEYDPAIVLSDDNRFTIE